MRVVRLHIALQRLECVRPLVELRDWALDVRWVSADGPSHVCVALAHNGALLLDSDTGTPLRERSCVEGCLLYSALLLGHQSWRRTVLVGGTVFNQLVLWKPGGEDGDAGRKAPVQRRLLGHSGVIFSISYLQEKGLLASASDDRSVRLWGVGSVGGPGGTCGDLNPACLRILYGHQARVFLVRLSTGMVFSAGEDGACLVWDWADVGRVVRTLKGHRAGGVRALAVSEETADEDQWVATGGADGGVRVWRMDVDDGSKENTEETAAEKLTDLKFSGDGAPKVVCTTEDENSLWSWSKFLVCTDRGTVYQHCDGHWDLTWRGSSDFQSYCVMETVSVTLKASLVHLCAVGNLTGSVFVFPVSHPQSGILLRAGSGKIHSVIWQKEEDGAFLLASGAEGRVYRWCIRLTSQGLAALPLSRFLLPPCAKRWLTAAVRVRSGLQGSLWVCGDRRGSLLLFQDKRENEHVQVEDEDESKDDLNVGPVSCLFGVHGKQGVTSVLESSGLFYSTGRDGCVRVFRARGTIMDKPEEAHETSASGKALGLQLEVLRVQRACKGMEWLERVLILEPEAIDEDEEDQERFGEGQVREVRFVIAGFHAVHFIVWDPVRRERLLAVPCGGGHRSWRLWPSQEGIWLGDGALVFVKQGTVLMSQPPGDTLNRTGKAGWTLREGVHGRGIGCVRRLGTIRELQANWEVVVTGGEDTSVSVLALQPDSGRVRVLSVLTDHISSVRTLAAVTHPRGGDDTEDTASLSALLVSAGGRAQMQCYRLLIGLDRQRSTLSCQVIQVARHRLDEEWERKRNRHKMVKMDPETRYMALAVVKEGTDCTIVALACSDGAVRLFSVRERQRRVDLLWQSFHHQRCVLSVATCSLQDVQGNRYHLLFSAATDGSIALWDLSPVTPSSAPPLPVLSIPAHQSGVNSLAVWTQEEDGGCLVTVASGGDDGQLTASVISVRYPDVSDISEPPNRLRPLLLSQLRVPSAHAAPLTALGLLRPGLLVSTSSDQRVCLWRVCRTGITHRGAAFSHVADAAALAVWEGHNPRTRSEIGGAGDRVTSGITGEIDGKKEAELGGGRTPEEAESETGDGSRAEAGGERGHETQRDGDGLKRATAERQRGWIMVCGQGFQLHLLHQTDAGEEESRSSQEEESRSSQEEESRSSQQESRSSQEESRSSQEEESRSSQEDESRSSQEDESRSSGLKSQGMNYKHQVNFICIVQS